MSQIYTTVCDEYFFFGETEFYYKKQDQGSTEKHFRKFIINYLVQKKAFVSLQGNILNQKNANFIQNVRKKVS